MIDDVAQTLLTFTLPLPISVNSMYGKAKNGRRFLVAQAKRFKDDSIMIARSAANVAEWRYREGQRLYIVCTYFFKDNRVADLDNLLKLSLDALKEALHFDDCWQIASDVRARAGGIDKRYPRCEVAIEVMAEVSSEQS